MSCLHRFPELHIIGESTVIACGECLVVLESDAMVFEKVDTTA